VSTEGIISSIKVGDVILTAGNTFYTPILFENKEYLVVVTGPGGVATQKVIISVGDWTTSNIGILDHDKFYLKSMNYITDGIIVGKFKMEDIVNKIFRFSKEGYMIVFDELGNIKDSSNKFSVGEGFIVINDGKCTIVKLTEKEFTYTTETIYDGKPSVLEYSYSRP
jgi:hypothetical protein